MAPDSPGIAGWTAGADASSAPLEAPEPVRVRLGAHARVLTASECADHYCAYVRCCTGRTVVIDGPRGREGEVP